MAYTIIVLEDDNSHRYAMTEHLASWGYAVLPVASGMVALREAENQAVHLLVADLYLPGGPHGLSVANILRHRFNIPAIFITGRAELAAPSEYPLPGRVFVKPVDLAELSAEIARRVVSESAKPPNPASETREQIRRWRMKAEELRTAAESFSDASARQHMLMAARTYDTLADKAEGRLHQRRDAKTEAG